MKTTLALILLLGMTVMAHGFVENFDQYDTTTFNPQVGLQDLLVGNGGWLAADDDVANTDVDAATGAWNNESWGNPGTANNNGLFFAPGGYNAVAHNIGTLTPGTTITFDHQINHGSSYLDLAIGSNLADGNNGNEVFFHVEMGESGSPFPGGIYYTVYPISGATVRNAHTDGDAGETARWSQTRITIGPGLSSINLEARNDTTGANWIDFGSISLGGSLPAGEHWLSLRGETNVNGWGRAAGYDNIDVLIPEPATAGLLAMAGTVVLLKRRR
ncbi:MAG: hypothetical protein CMJ18_17755 [Phycisphaeraceae bacterium]|nr:hypothetical protein [Phycisphaeraceae bacterium]